MNVSIPNMDKIGAMDPKTIKKYNRIHNCLTFIMFIPGIILQVLMIVGPLFMLFAINWIGSENFSGLDYLMILIGMGVLVLGSLGLLYWLFSIDAKYDLFPDPPYTTTYYNLFEHD